MQGGPKNKAVGQAIVPCGLPHCESGTARHGRKRGAGWHPDGILRRIGNPPRSPVENRRAAQRFNDLAIQTSVCDYGVPAFDVSKINRRRSAEPSSDPPRLPVWRSGCKAAEDRKDDKSQSAVYPAIYAI